MVVFPLRLLEFLLELPYPLSQLAYPPQRLGEVLLGIAEALLDLGLPLDELAQILFLLPEILYYLRRVPLGVLVVLYAEDLPQDLLHYLAVRDYALYLALSYVEGVGENLYRVDVPLHPAGYVRAFLRYQRAVL